MTLPSLRLNKGCETAMRRGMPWIMTHEIVPSSNLALLAPGELVSIETVRGELLGVGYYNALSHIACRVLAAKPNTAIDHAFFATRLREALHKRDTLYPDPYYRLVHSEGDNLPGLLIDRFGELLVVQLGTAGMERLWPVLLGAIEEVISPTTIVLRNDTGAREREGLVQNVQVVKGSVDALVKLRENNVTYLADVLKGQKTGWFFDQRDNRALIAARAKGKRVVDIFSHSGGFGLPAAKAGGTATLVDSSALALDIAQQAAGLNEVSIECIKGDAFAVMEQLAKQGRYFDIVLADPPAFVKSRKDIASGMKGYEKVARLACALVEPLGELFVASCSHHASRGAFNQAVMDGVRKAGRKAHIIAQTSAAADHPNHPMLGQNTYLKGVLLKLDD
jgi:23S rRNA (cytosine1962-C5)-methyltransferase